MTKSIYPMSLGWSINVLAVNLNTWNRLDPEDAGVPARADQGLRGQDVGDDQDDDRRGRQLQHRQAALHAWASSPTSTIVPVKPEEAETHKKLVEGAVLAGWAKRCGAECAKEWNETVGKALGLKAPTPVRASGPAAEQRPRSRAAHE